MSDERLVEIIENFDKYLIGIDDEFEFKCRGCGKCCRNRHDIMLNPRDLFRIAKHLKRTPQQIVDKYCQVYVGEDSRMTIARLLPVGGNDRCPFLVDKKCLVHEAKPTVCALYPIGRTIIGPGGSIKGLGEVTELTSGYIIQPIECGAKKKRQTVRQWLNKWGYPDPDAHYLRWNKFLIDYTGKIRDLEDKGVPAQTMNLIWDATFSKLYLDYDTEQDFEPQFDQNAAALLGAINETHDAVMNALSQEEETGEDGEE